MTTEPKAKMILPAGYAIPSSGNTADYLKLTKNNTRIRIMTPILPINRWWGVDGIYYSNSRRCPVDPSKLKKDQTTNLPGVAQHTWVFGCIDLDDDGFKIAEIYQRSITSGIMNLITSPDGWGDPSLYNITIGKPATNNRYASYTVTGVIGGYGEPPKDKWIEMAGEAWSNPYRWFVANLMGQYKDLDSDDPTVLKAISEITAIFDGKTVDLNFFKPSSSKDETKDDPKDEPPKKSNEIEIFAEDYHNGKRDVFIPNGGDELVSEFHRLAFIHLSARLMGMPTETMIQIINDRGYKKSNECSSKVINEICATLKDSSSVF